MTPCDRFTNWDRFDYTKADILVEPSLDLLSPVKWDRQGLMLGHKSGLWVNHQSHGWTVHHGEGLVLAHVKGAGLVAAEEPLL